MFYTISKSLNKWALKNLLLGALMLIFAGCVSSVNSGGGSGESAGSIEDDRMITGIISSVSEDSGAVKIDIKGNTSLTYTSLKQSIPLSIVLYFPGTRLENIEAEYSAISDIVSTIKTSQQKHESGFDSRIKILLNKDLGYEVSRIDNGLQLILANPDDEIAVSEIVEPEIYGVEPVIETENIEEVAEFEENSTNELMTDEEDLIEISADNNAVEYLAEDGFEVVEEDFEIALEVQASKPATKVIGVSRKIIGDIVEINIDGDGTIDTYEIFTIPANDKKNARIVCDIKGIEGIKTKGEHIILVDSNGVDKIRYFTYPDKMRIVVDVDEKKLKMFSEKTIGTGLTINIGSNNDNTLPEEIEPAGEDLNKEEEIVTIEEEISLEEEMLIVEDEDIATLEEDMSLEEGISPEEEMLTVEESIETEEEIATIEEEVSPEEEMLTVEESIETEEAIATIEEEVSPEEEMLIVEEAIEKEEEMLTLDEVTEPEKKSVKSNEEIGIVVERSESDEEIVPVKEEIQIQEPVLADEKENMELVEDSAQLNDDVEIYNIAASADDKTVYKEAAWLNRIDFSVDENGKSSIVIGTSHPVEYKDNKKDDKTIHFRLFNTKLPKSRKLPFITTSFDSAVNRILPAQTKAMKNNALFIIELREAVPYFVDQQGDLLTIHFEPSSVPALPEDKAGLPQWQEVLSQTEEILEIETEAAKEEITIADSAAKIDESVEEIPGHESDKGAELSEDLSQAEAAIPVRKDDGEKEVPEEEIADSAMAGLAVDKTKPEALIKVEEDQLKSDTGDEYTEQTGYISWAHKKKYIGEKISVDFYETDIKNVLRIIRAVSGQNFAIDKDVTGKATMTLDNPVPWDQVLDLVLKMNMLGMVSEGGINRIATLEALRMEEEKRLEYIEAEEKTKIKKKALEPLFTKYILINYADAASEIKPLVDKILTKDRGNLSVDDRTNQLILTDTDEKIQEVLELIKKLDRITPQVIIEARIVEASTSFSRSIGTEWGVMSNKNYDTYNDALGGTYGWNVAMNNAVATDSSFGINFTKLTGAQFLLNATLLAMESKGEGKIISAPKLITLDNKKATITQGFSYPYLTYETEEGTVTAYRSTTKFIDIELKLEVTPQVTSDKKISLKIVIDKDDIASMTDNGPSIATNNIETELLIDDGDTIVIGGVVKSNRNTKVEGFPVLSKIPVVGWLFKSKVVSDEKQELLIFLTPRIVAFAGD